MPDEKFTQVPNYIIESMPTMHRGTFAIVMWVARQTVGWQKEWDRISLSQFQDNTGLSRQGVIDAIADAVERGWVEQKHDGKQSFQYRLTGTAGKPVEKQERSTSQVSRLVNSVDQSSELTSTSQVSRPELVNSVDPQNTLKEIPKQNMHTHTNGNGAKPADKPKRERSEKQKAQDVWVASLEYALEFDAKIPGAYGRWAKTGAGYEKAGYTPEDVRTWKEFVWPTTWRCDKGHKPSKLALDEGLPDIKRKREDAEAKAQRTEPTVTRITMGGKLMDAVKHPDGRTEYREVAA